MNFIEFTDEGDRVYLNPLHIVRLSSSGLKTSIFTSGGKFFEVDQDIEEVKKELENTAYYAITVIADAIKTAIQRT